MSFGAFQYQSLADPVVTTGEAVFESKWHVPWSEPVRFRIVGQLAIALAASGLFSIPNPFISLDKYFQHWSDPVRFRGVHRGMPTGDQPVFTISPVPFVSFGWFAWLGGPAPPPIPGLSARLQQTLAHPPRLLPTPNITGTLNAIETKDTAFFGGTQFAPPTVVELGVVARLR